MSDLYRTKEPGYFSAARLDMLGMLPRGRALRMLEIGAGNGATLRAAKHLGIASYAVGVDRTGVPSPDAGEPQPDRFLSGDVEEMVLPFEPATFDVVLCADVLEHLVDPWGMVRRLAGLLKANGVFLASVPNFRNYRALAPILFRGDFRYSDAGLLDRTHLRFFCRRNIERLFSDAGLAVESLEENMGGYGLRHKAIDWATLGLCHELFVFQYRVCARKATA